LVISPAGATFEVPPGFVGAYPNALYAVPRRDLFQPAAQVEVGGDATRDVTIAQPMLTDVLIRFCLENNVALPRSGRKRAVGHAGQAALEIHVEDLVAGNDQPVARKAG
jgi:hypothetical protein